MVKNLIIASSAIAFLATAAFTADRSVALNKEIETIVFWPDQAKDQKDLQKSISLEFSYCLPCAVVKGKTDDKIDYDWSSFEKMLDDIASREHQAIVRFRIEYPSATITNASGCTEKVKGATAVPNYIKALHQGEQVLHRDVFRRPGRRRPHVLCRLEQQGTPLVLQAVLHRLCREIRQRPAYRIRAGGFRALG